MLFTIGELLIDVLRHFDHVPGGRLGGLLVAREIALHVAEVASLTESDREGAHHRADIFGL